MKTGFFFGLNAVDQFAPDYEAAGQYGGQWSGLLAGCVPDARDLAMWFASLDFDTRAVFSGWNVGRTGPIAANDWQMTGNATRVRWHDMHTELQAKVQPGDTVVIGYSGHGYQYDTPLVWNGGQGFCFFDGLYRDTDFHKLMMLWPAGVKVIYLIDSCYAGGMDRDLLGFHPKSMPGVLKPVGQFERGEMRASDVQAQVIQLCASRIDQTSADGQLNGVFTGTLLAIMDQAKKRGDVLTWKQLLDYTAATMVGHFEQTPQLNVLGAGEVLANELI